MASHHGHGQAGLRLHTMLKYLAWRMKLPLTSLRMLKGLRNFGRRRRTEREKKLTRQRKWLTFTNRLERLLPYRSYMLVESMVAEFEVKQVDATGDAHLVSEGKDLGPVKFQRISRRDIRRKMRSKSLQFIAVSGNCMWLAERDLSGLSI